ncbi:DgyrCDS5235 [Dimorphilus gyrociliatus]|uniref:DgyrCDS5235 n=1 Tax=Dimorphilus gyrociliatus TaxID=2664684 RepID=A0A7I8VJD9_9ANNE|nr:DgyrCDS5235 [Dimorphilus gyrociliatus]
MEKLNGKWQMVKVSNNYNDVLKEAKFTVEMVDKTEKNIVTYNYNPTENTMEISIEANGEELCLINGKIGGESFDGNMVDGRPAIRTMKYVDGKLILKEISGEIEIVTEMFTAEEKLIMVVKVNGKEAVREYTKVAQFLTAI